MNNKYNIPVQLSNQIYIDNCIFYDQYKYHDNTNILHCTRYIGLNQYGISVKITKQYKYE